MARCRPAWQHRATSILCVVLLGTIGCTADNSEPERQVRTDGTVVFSEDPLIVQTAGIKADAGQRVVFGATAVKNTGPWVAVLEGASLEGDVLEAQSSVVEVRVLDPEDNENELVGAAQWPFEDYEELSESLPGYRLESGGEAELLFVVRVERSGDWHWPVTTLSYSIGEDQFEVSSKFGFQVCPTTERQCPPP